ncbi:thioredoxin family protein [Paracoccus sp. (in: a-proteobacteria)]|uniref:thioredoxin family protein n=1 Tax=Paracoccus sp. TaxID=267 RepID=UPI003A87CB5B
MLVKPLTSRLKIVATALICAALPVSAPLAGDRPARIASDAIDWQAAPVRLLMVEQAGCIYCAAWHREIGPGFAQSAAGRVAPLLIVDLDGPWPDGLVLNRRPLITPTFVLLRDGKELSRLEGYPGDHYFYPVIAELLTKAGMLATNKEADG